MPPIPRDEFLRHFEKQCVAALADCHRLPCEETCLRASGRLDGLMRGASLALSTLCPDEVSLSEELLHILRRFQSELAEIQQGL